MTDNLEKWTSDDDFAWQIVTMLGMAAIENPKQSAEAVKKALAKHVAEREKAVRAETLEEVFDVIDGMKVHRDGGVVLKHDVDTLNSYAAALKAKLARKEKQ